MTHTSGTPATYADAAQRLRHLLTADKLREIGAVFVFHFPDGTASTLDGRPSDGVGYVEQDPRALGLTPDFDITLSREDFAQLIFGRLHPMAGMATGRLKFTGNLKEALKLDRLLKS